MPLIPSSLYVLVLLLIFVFYSVFIQIDSLPFETKVKLEHHYTMTLPPSTITVPTIPRACQHVDFQWLVNDRVFWDGWESKAMFLKQDGQYTRRHVEINASDTVCIVVLLGPTPALGEIQAVHHYAPSDAILMTARNKERNIQMTISLYQHETWTHAYYAQAQFTHSGTFELDTSVEHRSYFWEMPGLHPYRPNRFVSKNKLLVREKDVLVRPCFSFDSLEDSVWKRDQEDVWHFVPHCQPQQERCSRPKRIHVWGDDLLKRNIDVLVGNQDIISHTCTALTPVEDTLTIQNIEYNNSTIYFGYMNETIGNDYHYWKQLIYNTMTTTQVLETAPDVVILGVGNRDLLEKIRQTPIEFAKGFMLFLNYMIKMYGEQQTIIVKTTRWMNDRQYGKSRAYANIIRAVVSHINNDRVLLWDTHSFGMKDTACSGAFSNDYVVTLENSLLKSLFCQLPN